MGLKIGVVGAGEFSQCFFALLKAHPFVDEVSLAELIPDRRAKAAAVYGITRTFDSLDSLCKSDVDAVFLLSQRHLHGPHVLQALNAGKHVYSAVPMASSLEDIEAIIDTVKRTRLTYMTGETSHYYPSTVYCRDRFRNGDFGDFVYGQACYIHDMAHGFYGSFQNSGGKDWKRVAGIPPMYYCTHSLNLVLGVTGAYATHVSCLGYEDRHEDEIFRVGNNLWDNPFSNETALMRTSDGGMMRINEFRRAGWTGKNGTYMSIFGTKGSYEEHANSQVWSGFEHGTLEDITELLDCKPGIWHHELFALPEKTRIEFSKGVLSKVHHSDRLPKEFEGQPNGHLGSHQFLVDDFVQACVSGKLPPLHAWNAAKYSAPGLVAHESALRGGEMLKIPDFGRPPADWEVLQLD
ncbi:Gfo/Idh/MocA family protein [Paenibacillus montanisoli]|uniref:Gfo/Idh/MocA family oxidoreductase n=1 Tax=Paenibacillus montanisoli TaxID=2081970 RepID=A0A328U1Q4_9BACL|nr:Gfo/Idh/MocA family oxidoreductase [Paenibacillus montanisoli]RAP76569.1 gfo/Idh/MocA family oxidoreductase [Paenibacillus montanisoli]